MRSLWFLDCLVRVPDHGYAPDGRYSMHELTAPPGSQPPPHIHHDEDEGFYVLEGEVTLFTPDWARRLGPGEMAHGPQGVPHTFRAGAEGVRMLVVSAPAGFAGFIEEMSVPAERDALPVLSGPPDIVRLTEVAARHGIEFVGPPGALPAPARTVLGPA
jgi:quercetin dioxygenase-like cupin family protein